MAEPKLIRGTLAGVTVQVDQQTAERLGSDFQPESKGAAKKAAPKSNSK